MDLRIQTSQPFQVNTEKLYQQQSTNAQNTQNEDEPNFLRALQEKEQILDTQLPRETVLSMPEMATLHVLFGSEKPVDQGFYGKNSASQIYKGHLLDVAG